MAQPHNKKLGEFPMTTRGREQGPEKRYRRLRFPAFTAAKWTAANPLLQRGELGVETDTRKIKVGDGITYWNDLEYAKATGDWGDITGDITEQTDLVEFVNNAVAAEASIRAQADQQLQSNIDNVAANLTEHEQDTNNPHNVSKAQVGLANVDNTSDADKPVSTAQATAINNAVSTHNASETAHSNQFSQYRTSANQDTIDNQIKSDVANLQSTKADKATTLAGYGITDAYTKTEVDAKVSSVYRFRGSVATYSDLPTTGQAVGDVWNVEDTGANYAWTGDAWDKLSETIDLTPYLTKAEASSTYATQSALAEVSTVAETAQSTADKADSAAEVAQQTANVAGTTAAQALAGLDNKQDKLGFATATTAGIVRVGDGSQMVVNPTTGDISLDGTKAESIRTTIGAVAENQGTANAGKILTVGDDGNIELAAGASGAGRNIGDIFWTTRTDSALNGAVEANGAQYNFADVNGGDNNIQALLISGALPSVSIEEFDTKVASDGGCDSFGYDSGATYFKVPKKIGRVLVRSQKPTADNNYTWFNVYSDGWCEQGGYWQITGSFEPTNAPAKTIDMAIQMFDTHYSVGSARGATNGLLQETIFTNKTTSSFAAISYCTGNSTAVSGYWRVVGYANSAEYTPDKWDYQNVQVERPMVQLFNSATDEAVATCAQVLSDVANLNMGDYVIYWDSADSTDHSHAKPGVPTPLNHGWYRYYKSGWVEQGGQSNTTTNVSGVTVDFSIPVSARSFVGFSIIGSWNDSPIIYQVRILSQTTDNMDVVGVQHLGSSTSYQAVNFKWQTCGYAA